MNKQLTIGIVLGASALAGLFLLVGKDTDVRTPLETENTTTHATGISQNSATTSIPTGSSAITEDYISDEDDEPNEPVIKTDSWKTSAYTEPLPEKPSRQEAKYGFPDTNNNKVRDDIELLIIEEYGQSEMMVETLFAQARTAEYDLSIASDGSITQEEILQSNNFLSKDSACRFFYYTNTLGTAEEYFEEKAYQVVSDNYNNSLTRIGYQDDLRKALHGSVSKGLRLNHEQCQSYFKQTKNLEIGA